ncbi:MAG TPA: cupin domain-containing protein [Candidatus Limnocylindrales bacterium]|nr:cupin domain-containing protein [Candidatus Limnocylindrales bacterium]
MTADDTAAAETAVVPKPWGQELIWARTDHYVGKVITIETGRRLSLQYHEQKDESILILSGRLLLHLEDEDGVVRTEELGPGEHRRIPVGRRHRFEALARTELVEVSSPETWDVVRVEDDYGREGTTEP